MRVDGEGKGRAMKQYTTPAADVALYVLSGLHLVTLIQFCAHFDWVMGYNLLVFVPAILMSILRRSRWLLIVNLVLFVIGVIFAVLHGSEALSAEILGGVYHV